VSNSLDREEMLIDFKAYCLSYYALNRKVKGLGRQGNHTATWGENAFFFSEAKTHWPFLCGTVLVSSKLKK